jgi:two-component system, response regulator
MEDFSGIEVLLVEDNANDAELTMRAFKKCNIMNKLYWVRDGVEALDFIAGTGAFEERDSRELPRLILLDLKMPRLNGIDVLRALKSDERTHSIPIVVMTSSSEPRDLDECYQLGVNGYVAKPIEYSGLTDAVARIGMFWLLVNRVP